MAAGIVLWVPVLKADPLLRVWIGSPLNATGEASGDWVGEAVLYYLRYYLEPLGVLLPEEPSPPEAEAAPVLRLTSEYSFRGGQLVLNLKTELAGHPTVDRELVGEIQDPASYLAGLRTLLPAMVPRGAGSSLTEGLPTRSTEALRLYLEAESLDDLPRKAEAHREALKLDSEFADSRWGLAVSLYLLEDYSGAMEQFEAYRAARPEYGPAYNNLGMCLTKMARHGEAVQQFRTALKYDPGDLEARYNLARALAADEQLSLAEEEYRAIYSGRPEENRALLETAFIKERRGDHVGALEIVQGIPPSHSESAGEYFYNMGLREWEWGNLAGAKAAFRLALAMDPGDYLARLANGMVRYQDGDFKGAVGELQTASRLRNDDPDLYRYLGLSYRGLGQEAQAAESFRRSGEILARQAPEEGLEKGVFPRSVLVDGRGGAAHSGGRAHGEGLAAGAVVPTETGGESRRDESVSDRPATAAAEVSGQKREEAALSEELSRQRKRQLALEKEARNGREALKRADRLREELEKEFIALKDDNEILMSKYNELKDKHQANIKYSGDLATLEESFRRTIDESRSEVVSLKEQLREMEVYLQRERQSAALALAELSSREEQISALEGSRDDLARVKSSLEARLGEVTARLTELEASWDERDVNEAHTAVMERILTEPEEEKDRWSVEEKELKKSMADTLYAASAYHNQQGEGERALELLENLLILRPADPDAFYLRGSIFFSRGNFMEAIRDFNKSRELYLLQRRLIKDQPDTPAGQE